MGFESGMSLGQRAWESGIRAVQVKSSMDEEQARRRLETRMELKRQKQLRQRIALDIQAAKEDQKAQVASVDAAKAFRAEVDAMDKAAPDFVDRYSEALARYSMDAHMHPTGSKMFQSFHTATMQNTAFRTRALAETEEQKQLDVLLKQYPDLYFSTIQRMKSGESVDPEEIARKMRERDEEERQHEITRAQAPWAYRASNGTGELNPLDKMEADSLYKQIADSRKTVAELSGGSTTIAKEKIASLQRSIADAEKRLQRLRDRYSGQNISPLPTDPQSRSPANSQQPTTATQPGNAAGMPSWDEFQRMMQAGEL